MMTAVTETMEWILENIAGFAIVIFGVYWRGNYYLEWHYRIYQMAETRR